MITTYLRSSSYNDFDFCQQKFFLRYVLGLPDLSGKAADKGNIVHKSLELVGKRKVAQQNGEPQVFDEAFGEKGIDCGIIDASFACTTAWEYCIAQFNHHVWEDRDFKDCLEWTNEAMTYNGGMFNPLNLDIIGVEQKFDLEIIKPWSKYSFKTPNGLLEGYLGLKGTVDLVVRHGENAIEMIDWKTGASMKNWNTGEVKTLKCLEKDPQLRLYHYAAHQMYPDVDNIFITVYYIRAGGPHSVFFSKKDLLKTEELLQERFQQIKDTQRPRLIEAGQGWKCTKLCHYGKNLQEGSKKTICRHFRDEVVNLGLDKVTNKYANFKMLSEYGAGGGQYEVKP